MLTLRSAAFILVVMTAGPLLTDAVQIHFAQVTSPPFPSFPATQSPASEMVESENNSSFDMTKLTVDDVKNLLCEFLPDEVKDCKALSRERRDALLAADKLQEIVASRKRRSYYHWRPQYPSWWSHWNRRKYRRHRRPRPTTTTQMPTTTTADTVVVTCPNPIDQSVLYKTSADSADYPATDIAVEMIANFRNNTGLEQLLLGYEFIDEMDMTLPTVIQEEFRMTAVASCPFSRFRLYSYDSLINAQSAQRRCWVMQNFGRVVTYDQCTQKQCNTPSSGSILRQNLCLPVYEVIHFWAFCPHFPELQKFRRDSVVLATACRCSSVKCEIS